MPEKRRGRFLCCRGLLTSIRLCTAVGYGSSGSVLVGFDSVDIVPAVGFVNLIPSAFGLLRTSGPFCKLFTKSSRFSSEK